jgi:hypothetical protein
MKKSTVDRSMAAISVCCSYGDGDGLTIGRVKTGHVAGQHDGKS